MLWFGQFGMIWYKVLKYGSVTLVLYCMKWYEVIWKNLVQYGIKCGIV